MSASIADKAMLVRMSIHAWYARKLDKTGARAAAQQLQIEGGGDEYYKHLIPKAALEPISRVRNDARAYHLWATFPWYDNGLRVLPSARYFDYCQHVHSFRDLLAAAVEKLIEVYPTHKEFARAKRASLFKDEDYPASEALRDMFKIEMSFLPFPTDDFRVALPAHALDDLNAGVREQTQAVLESNVARLGDALLDKLGRVQRACENAENRVYDSTFESLLETCGMVRLLNITDDEKLSAVAAACENRLCILSPDAVRASPVLREQAYNHATMIMEMLNG